jgi:hypothetical protein
MLTKRASIVKYLILVTFVTFVLVSSKKESPNYGEMLKSIQKKWILSYGKGNDVNGNTVVDSVLGRPSYSLEDYIVWYPNDTFMVFVNIELDPQFLLPSANG